MNPVADEISRTSDSPIYNLAKCPAEQLLQPHMPALDVLRGIAILVVVIFHGMAYSVNFHWTNPVANALFQSTWAGWTGVNLFFVLSGFLITGNLMDSEKRSNYYSRFYIRRALRILPVYIVVLIVLLLTRRIGAAYAGVCIFFMANMPGLFIHGAYTMYSPLWSLAVEEQFYLGWPWIYKRLKRRGLILLCLMLMLICPLLRAAALSKILWTGDIFSKTWMIADNLAIGALIAGAIRSPRVTVRMLWRISVPLCALSAVILGLIISLGIPMKASLFGGSIGYSMIEIFYASVLVIALIRFQSRRLSRAFNFLVFLGDISYGLYLFHMLLMNFYDDLFQTDYNHSIFAFWMRFLVPNGIAVLIAAVSKSYFENPILRLKHRIPAAS